MSTQAQRVAILFPADNNLLIETSLEQSRLAETAGALRAVGIDVVAAPYADEIAADVRERLSAVDGVLVWYNPIERGRDRSVLNAMLRQVAARGAFVSAHPDVIDLIGTKEVLYHTRSMGWSCDTRLYETADAMLSGLPASLRSGKRVLKQIRGQSGDGIWLVTPEDGYGNSSTGLAGGVVLRVRHAKRGSQEEKLTLDEFVARCSGYLRAAGGMIDQAYQSRLPEGMVRCYLVRDHVAGFGEQLINALYPAAPGAAPHTAPEPGPRLYYPPTRPDFQRLKDMLERKWLAELCAAVGMDRRDLPLLWDADFLYGPRDADGVDTYVLCEINVSSVYPFPDTALHPLVTATQARLAERR